MPVSCPSLHFFFNDTATTEIYTLSLHDALPISVAAVALAGATPLAAQYFGQNKVQYRNFAFQIIDRKSTRLNSSHDQISYAVFCLKKKKKKSKYLQLTIIQRHLITPLSRLASCN